MFEKRLEATFEPMPFEDASEKYSIEGITFDDLSDLFPEDPETFLVHEGNVVVDGPMPVGFEYRPGEALTMYVIDGDLTVNGPLVFKQADAYAGLFVTGNVTCDNAYVAWDAQLFVGGSMTVKHLLATYITDAGHFSIKGSLSAGSWLECGDRGAFELGKKPKARLLRVGEQRYHVFGPFAKTNEAAEDEAEDEDDDDDERKYGFSPKEATSIKGILHPSLMEGEEGASTDKIADAMLKGRPLFADGSGASAGQEKRSSNASAKPKRAAPAKKPAKSKKAAPKPKKIAAKSKKSATKPKGAPKKAAATPKKKAAKKKGVAKPKKASPKKRRR